MNEERPETSGGPGPDDDVPPPLPRALHGPSRSAQVATVTVAVVVLMVLGLVLVLQQGGGSPQARIPVQTNSTEVPSAPPSGVAPSRNEAAPELPTGIPASLCPTAPLTQPLTVLSFNIHGGLTKRRSLQLDRVAAEITAWKADVVLLQEVDDGRRRTRGVRQAESLGAMTGMSWVYGGNQRRPDGGPIGNAILSRFPIREWSNVLLPRAGGKEQRGLLHAVVDVEGTAISFYSTHFDHSNAGVRTVQARAAAQVVAADQRPKILGGDLNSTPGSSALGLLRDAGLGDVWAVGSGSGYTAPGGRPRVRIDYVLHDGFFAPLQVAVLASAVSDHRAVWTRIEFRQELGCIKVGA